MKGIALTVLFSLALVFGMAAVSCDNGAAPDIGDKEMDERIMENMKGNKEHPGGVFNDQFDIDMIFAPSNNP
jgi:hypothetical protein